MLPDVAVVKALSNDVVPVMWKYDGLGGKVIQWTKQHGNTNDDPAHKIWLVDAAGVEIARADREGETASSLVEWLTKAIETWKKAKTPGIAHLFSAPADGVDATAAGVRPRVIWYAATDAKDAAPELKGAATRTKDLAEKVLSSKKLESLTTGVDLVRVETAVGADGSPADAATLATVPRIVLLGPATGEGKEPFRSELSGSSLTLDALVAALGKLPKAGVK